MEKEYVIEQIKQSGMVAVVRAENADDAKKIAESCIDGGIKAIELTFTVPYAHRIIEEISDKYGDEIILGAGTVLDPETARIAMLSGAEFIVAPHFNPDTAKLCNRYRKTHMAGILTVREAIEAMEAGTDILKLFPGDLFGPRFIKDIKGPLPYAQIMPTGGVDAENAGKWIKAGAIAVGAGSSLIKGDVKKNAQLFLNEIKKARNEM